MYMSHESFIRFNAKRNRKPTPKRQLFMEYKGKKIKFFIKNPLHIIWARYDCEMRYGRCGSEKQKQMQKKVHVQIKVFAKIIRKVDCFLIPYRTLYPKI